MPEPDISKIMNFKSAKDLSKWLKSNHKSDYSTDDFEVPADFIAALNNRTKARQFFETLTKSNRYTIAYGLESAKTPETRERRFKKFIDMLDREEKPN